MGGGGHTGGDELVTHVPCSRAGGRRRVTIAQLSHGAIINNSRMQKPPAALLAVTDGLYKSHGLQAAELATVTTRTSGWWAQGCGPQGSESLGGFPEGWEKSWEVPPGVSWVAGSGKQRGAWAGVQ